MTRIDERSTLTRWLLAAAACIAAAVLLGWLMPRGPMSTLDSLGALALCAGVGTLTGRLVGRWAALLAPLLFALAFELVRIGADGPTVDRPIFGGIYAVLAFVVGRGFDGLVMLVPMILGAFWGAAWRRRVLAPSMVDQRASAGLFARRAVLGLATAVLMLLVVALVRPASTAAIVGADGVVLPGSIAELLTVPIGGTTSRSCCAVPASTRPSCCSSRVARVVPPSGSMRIAGEPLEESLRRGHLGPARHRSIGERPRARRRPSRSSSRSRHDRGDRVPARPLRRGAHLPGRQLLGLHPGRARGAAAPRPVRTPTSAPGRW